MTKPPIQAILNAPAISGLHRAALAFSDVGIKIFPCLPNSKRPATEHGYIDATIDTNKINAWWTTNPLYNIGMCPADAGLFVVDIDPGADLSILKKLPRTRTVRTPRKGTHHYLDGVGASTVGKIAEHVDTRSIGGYVLVPPSVVNGVTYVWENEDDYAPIPAWISEALAISNTPLKAAVDAEDLPVNIARVERFLKECVKNDRVSVVGGGGDALCYEICCEVLDLGVSVEKAADLLDEHWNPHCRPRQWDYDKLLLKLNNAARYKQNENGAYAIEEPQKVFAEAVAKLPVEKEKSAVAQEIVSAIVGSEDDLALAFTQVHGRNLRYVGDWNKWLQFDGQRWAEIKAPAIWNLLRPLVRDYAAGLHDWSAAAQRKLASKATIANTEALARGTDGIFISADTLDADPWILNTPGGIVNLRTGVLSEPNPFAYCTKSTAVTPAPAANCPLWLNFLHRITGGDENFMKYLQRVAGYALTGITSEHAMFCLIGTGANGKGVYTNTLTSIWQDYATTAAADTFTASKNDRHPTDLAMLHGARLVTAQETNHGQSWNEAKLKSITGGDKISARKMHQDFFTFTPQLKLLVATNHKPNLHNVDEAIKRRLNVLPFAVTIPENERDHDLPEKLKAEWGDILQWAIQGCLDWQKAGLQPPTAVQASTRGYFETQDPLAGWLEARCVQEPNAWTSRSVLYSDYCDYMSQESEIPDGRKRFFERMETHGLKAARRGHDGARGFAGISLLPITPAAGTNTIPDRREGGF